MCIKKKNQKKKVITQNFQCINKGEGCQEALKINDVLQHANICQFALQTCNCGWRGKKSLLKDHEKNCPLLATQMCPTCKESILQSKFMKHNCISDLKENLEKISEKFFDYKESSEFAIKDLKNQFSHQILEIQDLKHLQQVMIAEQSELKNALQKLFAIYQEQEKKLKEVSEQDKIPECNLREAFTLKCANNHDLYYWFNPKGENRKKKCVKCQKNDVNIRYYCPICKIFLCLVCEQPEIVTRQNQSHCPARHPITRKNELPQNCSVCERSASNMLQPGGFSCGTCDFAICMSCIEAKRFNNKPQDCPVQ